MESNEELFRGSGTAFQAVHETRLGAVLIQGFEMFEAEFVECRGRRPMVNAIQDPSEIEDNMPNRTPIDGQDGRWHLSIQS